MGVFFFIVSLILTCACYYLYTKWQEKSEEKNQVAQNAAAHIQHLNEQSASQIQSLQDDASSQIQGLRDQTSTQIQSLRDQLAPYSAIKNLQEEENALLSQKNILLSELQLLDSQKNQQQQQIIDMTTAINLYDEEVEVIEHGLYKPHFDFSDTEQYKIMIKSIRNAQKHMISSKVAVISKCDLKIQGSITAGNKMLKNITKTTLRAFNSECEASVANVRWNNVLKMEERIKKCFSDLNKSNEDVQIHISDEYLKLKLKELYLVHEHHEKVKEEKEQQAEMRRQMREDAKVEQELLNAQQEEEKYQAMLAKAQQEVLNANTQDMELLNSQIAELSLKLQEAHAKNERAQSMAQQTKSGHVYIISNVGSFGDDVYKIGMTRRLEPMERIWELGDASVPFCFDVHAMIYSDNAPEMESRLHKKFASKRLNLINQRKEFFKVSLQDIETEVKLISPTAEFITTAEASEYIQTKMLRLNNETIDIQEEKIPMVLFEKNAEQVLVS